jgi:serine/threonine protein kinase
MGEVYRARDTKLGRDVALKILPEIFAADAQRLGRFQREAMTLASLNHPNIAQIHGVEENGLIRALVMELVEGDDLAMRVARSAIPVDAALPIARQIADALEAAHQVGIVHRDLKPANIKLRPDGTVKVLDFGLAKAAAATPVGGEGAGADPFDLPTLTSPAMTEVGVILGTAAYMAPEQAKGQAVDRRADIWAFGCVVFEMLTGRRCFAAGTVTEMLAAVLTREPEWTALPETTPDSIRRMLKRCLQKDPKRRLHDIADARIELEDGAITPSTPIRPSGVWPTSARWTLGLGAIFLAALALVSVKLARLPEETPSLVQARRLTDMTGFEESPALSPDGRQVAFTAGVNDKRQIYIQLLAGGAPLRLTGDDVDHQSPRWTPDSSSIVYFSPATPGDRQGTLWEIPALGGSPRRVGSSVGPADISADRRLAFFQLTNQAMQLVTAPLDASTVNVVAVFKPAYCLYPRWSPDGKWIAFQRGDTLQWEIFAAPTTGGEVRQLTKAQREIFGLAWLPDSSGVVYSSSLGDTMLYLPTARLWQVTLADGATRQVTSGETSYMQPDITRSGAIVVSRMRRQSDIWKFPTDGPPAINVQHGIRVTQQTGQVLTPTAGPGEKEVAFLSDSGGHANIWVTNVESGGLRQITHEQDPSVTVGVPVWSPQGDSIAFVSSRGNAPSTTLGIWLVNRDGGNLRQLANPGVGPAWSPDGHWVYYTVRRITGQVGNDTLFKVAADGGSQPITVRTDVTLAMIGSDGQTLYFRVTRALVDGLQEFEIRAATPEDGSDRSLARISHTRVPNWQTFNSTLSPDGKWIAQPLTDEFSTNVWALSTATGEWRQLTDFGGRPTFIARRVSWSADGRHVFAAVAEGDADIVLLDGLLKAGRQ